ncbi:MAG: hypothetical protein NZ740_07945 [Kiritimatiellae bacterium]|nr:hypothetical protein [Kiritimatiellia bacterium]MDW8459026.1 hypothetical protein [Verrucomicrobiota bacterium]
MPFLFRVHLWLAHVVPLALSVVVLAPAMTACRRIDMVPREVAEAPDVKVRVVEREGALWFAHGEKLFRSVGVCAVIPVELDYTRGGIRYPLAYDGPAAHGGDEAAWRRSTLDRLSAWGFNTLGAWSDAAFENPGVFWHTPCLWLGGYRGQPDMRLVDVWAPQYAAEMDRMAAEQLAPWRDRRDVIGFFLNNELPWYGEAGWPVAGGRSLLDRYLELSPGAPGRAVLAEWLRATYSNDFRLFLRDWETHATSFAEIRTAPEIRLRKRRPAAAAIVEAWAGVVADRYFQLSDEVFRRHAPPGSLNLGVRFAGRVYPSVLAACGRYADVISFNDYQPAGEFQAAYFDALHALTRKPILITEFSWRADENRSGCKNTQGAPVTVPTQRDRAARYEAYVGAASRHPAVVGWHWFCWADQPPGGRFDGENSNYGLVDLNDQPYLELVGAMERLHRRKPRRDRLNQGADLSPLAIYRPIRIPDSPAREPVQTPASACSLRPWFDDKSTTRFDVATGGGRILIRFDPDPAGWGGGISLVPPRTAADVADTNCFSLLGRRGVEMRIQASRSASCRLQLVETGAGPVGEQAYAGRDGADGEVYVSYARSLTAGDNAVRWEWDELDVHEHYGNQRGNRRIDLQALQSVDLYLPADANGPGPLVLEIQSITFF